MSKRPSLWRRIEYTNDGCTLYQCLRCKDQWECSNDVRGEYSRGWKFCPYCGCEWGGERVQYYEGSKSDFIARVYGREVPDWPRPMYRYDILEKMPVDGRWQSIGNWYPSHNEFYLTPHPNYGNRQTGAGARESVSQALKDHNCFWWDESNALPVKVVLEKRIESKDRYVSSDTWKVIGENRIKATKEVGNDA